jgi:pimeloyl-ACP methyl ester carboxylesterase
MDGIALRFRQRAGVVPVVVAPMGCWLAEALEDAAAGRAVLTYDPRGRGESGPLDDEATVGLDADVADLERVCEQVSTPIAGVGWGYYGSVLAAFAARWPERVERRADLAPPRDPRPGDGPRDGAAPARSCRRGDERRD